MPVVLPRLSLAEFSSRLRDAAAADLEAGTVERLWIHYEELCRWSAGLSLIGPGTAEEVISRHYAESLAALPLLEGARRLVDLGSGAGFPGWVLAAARPDLDAWLVESRRRKALFLETCARKASLSLSVVNARVVASLPEGFPGTVELLTVRAVRLEEQEISAMKPAMVEGCRILRWRGPATLPVPDGYAPGRRLALPNSQRVIEELVQRDSGKRGT